MLDTARHEKLIGELTGNLRPVQPLPPAWLRAIGWLAVAAAFGAVFACFADMHAFRDRLASVPDMWLSVLGSTATAVLAAFAVFQTSVPGRNLSWALLPLPAALLWIGASGAGCVRAWIVPGTNEASLTEARTCLVFIIGISLPLSLLLFGMLQRACPLRPGVTSALGGLAAAAAAATLLNFFHPYDAAATDLLIHCFAVGIVVLANRVIGAWFLNRRSRSARAA